MRRDATWFPTILLTAALLAGPVFAAVLLSLLIDLATPRDLQGTALAVVGAVLVTLYFSRARRQAVAAPE